MSKVKCFLRSEKGPTVTEYAVLLALIVGSVFLAISALGFKANVTFAHITQGISTVEDGTGVGVGDGGGIAGE